MFVSRLLCSSFHIYCCPFSVSCYFPKIPEVLNAFFKNKLNLFSVPSGTVQMDTEEVSTGESPLTVAPLRRSKKFILEKEDGDLYSDTEHDMPGYDPPRCLQGEMSESSANVSPEQARRKKVAKKNLIETHKVLVDAGSALGFDLCKIYKESRIEYMIDHLVSGETQCPICRKVYCKTSSLKDHMVQHLMEPRFVCKICYKGFREHKIYNRHVLTYERKAAGKLVPCDFEGCDAEFDTVGHKNQHMKMRTDSPHTCEWCEKELTTIKGLKDHQAKCKSNPDGVPPKVKCLYCDKEYVDKKQANRHIKTKHPAGNTIGGKIRI